MNFEFDDYKSYFIPAEKVAVIQRLRMLRCVSCNTLIIKDTLCLKLDEFKNTKEGSIDERIHGEEKQMAPKYLCPHCTKIHYELGGNHLLYDDISNRGRK